VNLGDVGVRCCEHSNYAKLGAASSAPQFTFPGEGAWRAKDLLISMDLLWNSVLDTHYAMSSGYTGVQRCEDQGPNYALGASHV
jgi:hypothetical protein